MPRREGAGRPLGAQDKRKVAFREALRAYIDKKNCDPHRYMADLIADMSLVAVGVDADGKPVLRPAVSVEHKLMAAKELAQYLEPKMRAIEVEAGPETLKAIILHRYGRDAS